MLIGSDGAFLGTATSNEFGADSTCNEFGSYGSPFSTTSIFNEFGAYGSQFAASSAYNPYSSKPPALICSDSEEFFAYVTKNSILTPSIDPDLLCASLAANGQ